MGNWKTELNVYGTTLGEVNIRRGIFQGDSLSPLCVQSSMLHGSETWPIRKENEMALQRAEMRMVR